MAQKLKDYYDLAYARMLGTKLNTVAPHFDVDRFCDLLTDRLEHLEFNDRQVLLATTVHECLGEPYPTALKRFHRILGPELPGSLGMFTQGFWLWPLGKYVELYGAEYFEESTAFSKELTKRFTSEFCLRPVASRFPERTMHLMVEWSLDPNQRVRRCASECLRIRLPWAKRLYVALDHFDLYVRILSNLRNDPDKTIQKSVANNLNDLYREQPDKFESILALWQQEELSPACAWIIRHASRTKRKEAERTSR